MIRPLSLVAALAVAASAQELPSSSLRVFADHVSFVYTPPRPAPVVTGAPYSAEQLLEYTAPGAASPPQGGISGRFARDSQGRTWSSRAMKAANYWLTEIYDPVAGVVILLDDDAKVAHRMVAPAVPSTTPQNAMRGAVEALGTRLIDGIAAEGTRVSGPLTIETWKSADLRIELEMRSSNGYASRLVNLTRSEPDPALFRAPAGYRIVDEAGPFPMTIKTR